MNHITATQHCPGDLEQTAAVIPRIYACRVAAMQLDLFYDRPGISSVPETESMHGRPQLDLFGDRHRQLEHARRALTEARAGDAHRELSRLHRFFPDDAGIAADLDLARRLERRLGEIEAAFPGERPRLYLALARAATAGVRTSLLRRAAAELRRESPTAMVDDQPASMLLLAAGDVEAAWQAADEAVRHGPRARFVAYLADVEHRLEHKSRARELYRRALALDPFDVDWGELADDAVKELPDIAQSELELDDGVAWSAPAGVVLGVLPIGESPAATAEPPSPATESAPLPEDAANPSPPELVRARQFLDALVRASRASGPSMIAARREMRALAPQLLAAYLARR